MTAERKSELATFQKRFIELEQDFDVFATGIESLGEDPIWDIWQPLSTATARLDKYVAEQFAKEHA